MSTVLEKAVLTDDTGKQIKGTLEEIRDAITGSGSTHYPVRIQVATPPEKVDYIVGDTLDLTGIIVNAIFDNGVPYDVTENCTFDPDDGDTLTAQDTAINVTWTWTLGEVVQTFHASRAINVSTVESIEITTPPDTVDYTDGDTLDLTGMVVKANMSNGSQINVTSQCTYSPDEGDTLTTSDTAITVTLSVSGSTFTATQAITVANPVYGVEWDGSSNPAFTRTDGAADFVDPVPYRVGESNTPSSPFDNIMPWSGMVKVTDAQAGELVAIPKFWYKWTKNGSNLKLQIADRAVDGFHVSPAHADRGDGVGERDVVYVGRYQCSSSTYKSETGATPYSANYSNTRTNIHSLGSDIWPYDFTMFWTIAMLYLVEYATWDSQTVLGYGNGNSSGSGLTTTGSTDGFPYHSGGRFDYSIANNQYRWIEFPWGNGHVLVDGLSAWDRKLYAYGKNPANYDDNNELIGTLPTTYQYVVQSMTPCEVEGYEFVLIPTSFTGSLDEYITDNFKTVSNSNTYNVTHGQRFTNPSSADNVKSAGMFEMDCATYYRANGATYSRLMKLPSA